MEQRKTPRLPAGGNVLYHVGDVVRTGPLYNLSRRGCLIEADAAGARPGDPVRVTLVDGLPVAGTVVWVEETGFGVRFAREIGDATVRYFRLTDWDECGLGSSPDPD